MVFLLVVNATEEEADKVAARVREIVPCRYPIVYFTDKLILLPYRGPEADLGNASVAEGAHAVSSEGGTGGGATAVESASASPAAERAGSKTQWTGVMPVALFAALVAVLLGRITQGRNLLELFKFHADGGFNGRGLRRNNRGGRHSWTVSSLVYGQAEA